MTLMLAVVGVPAGPVKAMVVPMAGFAVKVGNGGVPSHTLPAPVWLLKPGWPRCTARSVRKFWRIGPAKF